MDSYFRAALAPSSQKTYASAQNRYIHFCTSFNLNPLPLIEHQLCQYVSYLAEQNIAHSSIKGYLSALRHMQIASGRPDPGIASMPKLEGVVKGIKSMQARTNRKANTRLPVTADILRQIGAVWEQSGPSIDHRMLWAAVTLAFFGFMRAGELTTPSENAFDPLVHPTLEDVSVDEVLNPRSVKLRLKASKTDPFRRGVDIVVGTTGNKLCPVSAMLSYLAVRSKKSGPLFQFANGGHLTKARFVGEVRKALTLTGLNPLNYAGHSFRIGAATAAAAGGIPEAAIQMLGRWTSSAYLLYIRTPRDQLAKLSVILGEPRP